MAECDILDGVVAYVYGDGLGGVSTKLRQLGAQIASRLSKDVSHVVFHRSLEPTAEARAAEDAELRALFEKGNKVCFVLGGAQAPRRMRVLRAAPEKQTTLPLPCTQHHKTTQFDVPPSIVSALWVETSLREGRRAIVRALVL